MALVYEQQDRVVTITLNRPEAMNAIDPETHQRPDRRLDAVSRRPEAWVAILTGAGEKAFSRRRRPEEDSSRRPSGARGGRKPQRPGARRHHPRDGDLKPIIAAVNGYALAGGLELMLCCDIRVAAEHAVFGLTEVRWAIMPGAGGTQRLPRTVPLAKAMEMILMGETCSAQEAHRIGLVNAVRPRAGGAADARGDGREPSASAVPLAVRAAKEAIIRDSRSRSPTGFGWRRSCPGPSAAPRMRRKAPRHSRRSGSPCSGRASVARRAPLTELSVDALRARITAVLARGRQALTLEGRVRAAVLVLFVYREALPALVFGKKTEDVPHHKGQFSFPGGVVQHSDGSVVDAALREAWEEIGLEAAAVEVLGPFDDVPTTVTNFVITPVLALARGEPTFRPDGREIERVIGSRSSISSGRTPSAWRTGSERAFAGRSSS